MNSSRMRLLSLLIVFVTVAPSALAMDTITYRRDGFEHTSRGDVMREARGGQLTVKERDGTLRLIEGDEIISRESDDEEWSPMGRDELFEVVSSELQVGFERHDTAHYMIVYNTTDAYAEWCGALFERLHFGFTNYWSRRDHDIHDIETPLVAIVFRDEDSFNRYFFAETGRNASNVAGFYAHSSNRMVMFDLTGVEAFVGGVQHLDNAAQINLLLSQPAASETVATIVHEATHQLSYNCGLQRRFANNPLWVSEGIATYFETPDLNSRRGWRGIGEVSADRVGDYLRYMQQRPENSLRDLIESDERFRNPRTIEIAYDESWMLTHYLARRYSNQLNDYVRELSQLEPGVPISPAERSECFETAFGKTVEEIEAELLRYAIGLGR